MIMLAKHVHVTTVVLTFILFVIRGIWMIMESDLLHRKWTRRVPPVIDTVLLGSAIYLAISMYQYPFVHHWLTAKVLALVAYIGFGMLALTYGRTRRIRIGSWMAALLCFFYIVAVAVTKNPLVLA
ncbi:MAG: SirB2 family protein [Thiogranum sp.]|nr:SirB2 family protein [Thiogranum sp.]